MHRCEALYCSMGLSRDHTPEENRPSSSQQPSVANPFSGLRHGDPFPSPVLGLGLILPRFCACHHSHCELMWQQLCHVWKTLSSGSFPISWVLSTGSLSLGVTQMSQILLDRVILGIKPGSLAYDFWHYFQSSPIISLPTPCLLQLSGNAEGLAAGLENSKVSWKRKWLKSFL